MIRQLLNVLTTFEIKRRTLNGEKGNHKKEVGGEKDQREENEY